MSSVELFGAAKVKIWPFSVVQIAILHKNEKVRHIRSCEETHSLKLMLSHFLETYKTSQRFISRKEKWLRATLTELWLTGVAKVEFFVCFANTSVNCQTLGATVP